MHRGFQRGYQACEECRKRKSRCELGGNGQELFAFSGPPCAYCRRTRRACVFRDERNFRKRRRLNSKSVSPSTKDAGAKAQSSGSGASGLVAHVNGRESPDVDILDLEESDHQPAASSAIPITVPIRRPASVQRVQEGVGFDTSHLAGRNDTSGGHENQPFSTQTHSDHQNHTISDRFMHSVISKGQDCIDLLSEAAADPDKAPANTVDYAASQLAPSHGGGQLELTPAALSTPLTHNLVKSPFPHAETLSVWGRSNFVKTGLLSAKEALIYIDAFFVNLSPKSPVLTDYFADHGNHHELLFDEPFLCSTIMMISSRYHTLPGIASTSRGQFIHDQLWIHVQGLIQQLILGQTDCAAHRIRSVGTIEALLLLSEWYARAMQFNGSQAAGEVDLASTSEPESRTEFRFEDLVEPSRRFDRMSWMLLGAAQILAHELGILQDSPEEQLAIAAPALRLRCARARELLFIYVTLLAARLGFRSMITLTFNPVFLGRTTNPSSGVLVAWIDLIKLTKTIHTSMFSSKSITRDLLQSGNYLELLEHFEPLLSQWQHKYLGGSSLDSDGKEAAGSPSRELLVSEYLYVRMYSFSPALQALASRASSHRNSRTFKSTGEIPSATLEDLAEQPEYRFIRDVIHDARRIVKRVIIAAESASLRLYPARTFQRFISACVFLLKASLLGVQKLRSTDDTSTEEVIDLLRQSVWALKVSAIDDAHLATYYAVLLERQLNAYDARYTSLPVSGSSVNTANTVLSGEDRIADGPTEWQAGLTDLFNGIDLFADFTTFGELGFVSDLTGYDL